MYFISAAELLCYYANRRTTLIQKVYLRKIVTNYKNHKGLLRECTILAPKNDDIYQPCNSSKHNLLAINRLTASWMRGQNYKLSDWVLKFVGCSRSNLITQSRRANYWTLIHFDGYKETDGEYHGGDYSSRKVPRMERRMCSFHAFPLFSPTCLLISNNRSSPHFTCILEDDDHRQSTRSVSLIVCRLNLQNPCSSHTTDWMLSRVEHKFICFYWRRGKPKNIVYSAL